MAKKRRRAGSYVTTKKPAPKPKTPRDLKWWLIGGGALLLVAIVAATVILLNRRPVQTTASLYQGIAGGLTDDGLPYLGPPDAPVTLIEYTDFTCSHCRDYALESEEGIFQDYVATGKVRYVVHYYTNGGLSSIQATEAAMCAGEQGFYFQFRKSLFENFTVSRDELIARAQAMGMDVERFTACWDSGRPHKALLDHSAAARKEGVTGTPSFKINDRLVVGNRPDEIRRVIEEELPVGGQ